MVTLQIEHPIHDLTIWLTAFARFADARHKGGVQTHRVCQPMDDAQYIVVELDFETVDAAERFKTFLEVNVWSSPAASPGLAGTPQTRILKRVLPESERQ